MKKIFFDALSEPRYKKDPNKAHSLKNILEHEKYIFNNGNGSIYYLDDLFIELLLKKCNTSE